MIKKSFLLLPLLFGLLQTAAAQGPSPGYTPGNWYAGLKHENGPLPTVRNYQPGIVVGYNLRPRLALQVGLSMAGKRSYFVPDGRQAWAPPGFTGTIHYVSGNNGSVYVPLHLRYLFSQPHRRFQTYGLVGFGARFSSFNMAPSTFQDGVLVSWEERRGNSYGGTPNIGFGLRARVVNRLFLNTELQADFRYTTSGMVGQTDRKVRVGTLAGIGLQYEFR